MKLFIVFFMMVQFICFLALVALLIAYICFSKVFKTSKRLTLGKGEYDLPPDDIYKPYYPQMRKWVDEIRSMDRELLEIKSFDGLTLRGYYYEYSPDSPIELLFHGYGGNAERDLSGGVERCFALGRSAILIDQRGAGMSDGNVCSFGINERFDCIDWIYYVTSKFGSDRPLIIGGISMGASTVMMAAGEGLPKNVVCVMADCGYSCQKEIICKVLEEMKLPVDIVYPFIKLGASLYGKFDLEEITPIDAVAKSKTPMIFIHGDNDAFVPHSMSLDCYAVCKAPKKMVTIEGAGHGLAFPADRKKYIESLRDFEKEANIFNK